MISARWILKEPKSKKLPASAEPLPRIVRHLLSIRGEWDDESLAAFLHPKLKTLSDPFLIGEMDAAVSRIFEAIDEGQKITLFGDYDVDGITSVTLMTKVLQEYGADVHAVIPLRGKDGYGLTRAGLTRAFKENPDCQLLIAMDCGTSSVDEVKIVSERGVDVVILDHHESNTGIRPNCVAIVNPKAEFTPTKEGDFSYLCAAGVVFKVCHALMKTRHLETLPLKNLLDYVAIATVADIVPLIDENRILVKHGLRALGTTTKVGLNVLKEVSGVNENPESEDIGFKIGPRINAAGRMDSPLEAYEVLMTDDAETADYLVQRLNHYNSERQSYEKSIMESALKMVEEGGLNKYHCMVIGHRGWHPGVVGIVASRIMRRYFKPTFIIAFNEEGQGKGSGRSINGLSLTDAIESGRKFLSAGGGHKAAAGISLAEEDLEGFQKAVNNYFETETTAEQRLPVIEIDAEVDFSELTFAFLESYEQLKPFGSDNVQPIFMAKGVTHATPPRELKNHHLKLNLAQKGVKRDAMFFGGGALELPSEPWDIAFTVDKNIFRGRTNLQIVIKQVRKAE